jgi:hypothetical protein
VNARFQCAYLAAGQERLDDVEPGEDEDEFVAILNGLKWSVPHNKLAVKKF